MSNNIRLSKKYGVNPSLGICFWCGENNGEIILFGKIGKGRDDQEAPKRALTGYEPCFECRKKWELGVAVLEASEEPVYKNQPEIQNGIYPTGRWSVVKEEAAERIFQIDSEDHKILLLDKELYEEIGFGDAEC